MTDKWSRLPGLVEMWELSRSGCGIYKGKVYGRFYDYDEAVKASNELALREGERLSIMPVRVACLVIDGVSYRVDVEPQGAPTFSAAKDFAQVVLTTKQDALPGKQ